MSLTHKRLKQAYIEMKDIYSYDYVVVNDEINNAVEMIHQEVDEDANIIFGASISPLSVV